MTAAVSSLSVGERFGRVVRTLRESRGWSQERLAHVAELNRTYMGEIERAAAMPSLATAAKLALALDVPLSSLISLCEVGTPAESAATGPAESLASIGG